MKDVIVTYEHNNVMRVVARFNTVLEAEKYLADLEKDDPTGIWLGYYGIDAPEDAALQRRQ